MGIRIPLRGTIKISLILKNLTLFAEDFLPLIGYTPFVYVKLGLGQFLVAFPLVQDTKVLLPFGLDRIYGEKLAHRFNDFLTVEISDGVDELL